MAKAAKQPKVQEQSKTPAPVETKEAPALSLNGSTSGKFVLFTIPARDRVEDGPVLRGFIETGAGKINVAGWKKTGRDSGTDYLSLKVGNTKPRPEDTPDDVPEEWVIGPFYGRMFRELVKSGEQTKVKRYFGFIEDSVKVGEDPKTHKGVYRTNWQIQIKAKPDVSNDGKTHYVNGTVYPRAGNDESVDDDIPF
jgi:hypothetical protein